MNNLQYSKDITQSMTPDKILEQGGFQCVTRICFRQHYSNKALITRRSNSVKEILFSNQKIANKGLFFPSKKNL